MNTKTITTRGDMDSSKRRVLLSERVTGTRSSCGVDWPVRDTLVRERLPGRGVRWVLTSGICNGTADKVVEFRLLREARAAWEGR